MSILQILYIEDSLGQNIYNKVYFRSNKAFSSNFLIFITRKAHLNAERNSDKEGKENFVRSKMAEKGYQDRTI